MTMTYEEMVKKLAETDMTEIERGENLIRSMCGVIDAILNYKYVLDHYKGDSDGVIQDQINSIKNAMAIMVGDADVYMMLLGITDKVRTKADSRIGKILRKMREEG